MLFFVQDILSGCTSLYRGSGIEVRPYPLRSKIIDTATFKPFGMQPELERFEKNNPELLESNRTIFVATQFPFEEITGKDLGQEIVILEGIPWTGDYENWTYDQHKDPKWSGTEGSVIFRKRPIQ